MKEEDQKRLMNSYPSWFNTEDKMKSLMCFGFNVGDGWTELLEILFCTIDQILKKYDAPDGAFEIVQVKEKFGGLRCYYEWNGSWRNHKIVDKEIHGVVRQAEKTSFTICELCGNPGQTMNDGWTVTLCDECRELRVKQRKDRLTEL